MDANTLLATLEDTGDISTWADLEITPDGYKVKETEDHIIMVVPMIFNWRVTRSPKDMPGMYDRAWCYYGTGLKTFMKAVLAAKTWNGADDTAPAGWDKNAITGQYACDMLGE